jgi:hypothetical protein
MDHITAPDVKNRTAFQAQLGRGGAGTGYLEIKYRHANVFVKD